MSEHKDQERELLKALAQQKQRPTCLTCMHCQMNAQSMAHGQGECWYNPPATFPIQGEGGKMGRVALDPPVQLTVKWCAHHKEQLIHLATSLPPIAKAG